MRPDHEATCAGVPALDYEYTAWLKARPQGTHLRPRRADVQSVSEEAGISL
jgi:hypothetical protein